jgi:hypothetical protein
VSKWRARRGEKGAGLPEASRNESDSRIIRTRRGPGAGLEPAPRLVMNVTGEGWCWIRRRCCRQSQNCRSPNCLIQNCRSQNCLIQNCRSQNCRCLVSRTRNRRFASRSRPTYEISRFVKSRIPNCLIGRSYRTARNYLTVRNYRTVRNYLKTRRIPRTPTGRMTQKTLPGSPGRYPQPKEKSQLRRETNGVLFAFITCFLV